jgi:hypothetical protein
MNSEISIAVTVEASEALILVLEAMTAVLKQQAVVIALVREIREDRPRPPKWEMCETTAQYEQRLAQWARSLL